MVQIKTILITGSTDGIGKLAAIKLAKDGHNIIVHGRNSEKVNNLIKEIINETENKNIFGFVSDFSDLDSVKSMTNEIKKKFEKLDVLINNAGVYKSQYDQNSDGYDIRIVVNYFAPYVLTNELMEIIENAENPRIINLSSAAQSKISLDFLSGDEDVSESEAYAQSKLAITMWSMYLSEKKPNLIVIPVNPGSLLNTNMVKEAFGRHWSDADKGAQILYDLSVQGDFLDKSGKYFDNDQGSFGRAHEDTYDEDKIKELVEFTENLLN